MKEIFDWLRENIEANSVECGGADIIGLHRVRVLINQTETMVEQDCCEYMHVQGVGYCSSGCGGYAHDYILVSEWKFCPHCGKRIKISEVE